MNIDTANFKKIPWKHGVIAPPDAARPRCNVLYSLDGVSSKLEEDDTNLVDWLIVVAYQTQE